MKKRKEIDFLGSEFLTWIYWKSSEEGTLSLENLGLGEIHLSAEETISLNSVVGDGYSETIKSRDIAELDSVRKSMKEGHLPETMKVRIISNELEWFFQIRANPLKVSSVKLPFSGEKEVSEAISLRLDSLTRLDLILQALFNTFLIERDEPEFVSNLKKFLEI
ncbi:MAG: hypothetical protein ACOX2F_08790 [bacterium]